MKCMEAIENVMVVFKMHSKKKDHLSNKCRVKKSTHLEVKANHHPRMGFHLKRPLGGCCASFRL
jgi:hypothetical protein